MNGRHIASFVFLVAVVISSLAVADTTFTYQGELKENGGPANGSYSMNFSLWNSAIGGSQAGPTVLINNVQVVAGRFTVELDFGSLPFDNSDRWLELEVNGHILSPRNPVSRTPYSIQTRGMFVDENHDVGIGTTNPNAKFQVVGNGIGAAVRISNGSSNDTGLVIADVIGSARAASLYGVTSSELLKVQNDGTGTVAEFVGVKNAVIGTSSSFASVGVTGESQADHDGAGVYGFASSSSGQNYGVLGQCNSPQGYDFFAIGAGVNYGSPSSQRWKQNVKPIDEPLEKISQLRGVYFDWDEKHGGQHDVGMIAEEVGQVLPEIVQYEENGMDAQGMDYSKLTPLLIEAVKALKVRNQSTWTASQLNLAKLKTDNEVLRQRVSDLEMLVQEVSYYVLMKEKK